MTSDLIKSLLCQWLNSRGYKAIKAPSDNPAPAGRYISVNIGNVRQHGDMFIPGPVDEAAETPKYKSIMQVASVTLYEVEGEGEWLRDIRNRLQTDEFVEFAADRIEKEPGKDNSISVWELGEIVDNSSQDGGYWIRQRTMSFDVQFLDHIEHNVLRMASVDFELQENNSFEVE